MKEMLWRTNTADKIGRNITWATETQQEWKYTGSGNIGWEAINGKPLHASH